MCLLFREGPVVVCIRAWYGIVLASVEALNKERSQYISWTQYIRKLMCFSFADRFL